MEGIRADFQLDHGCSLYNQHEIPDTVDQRAKFKLLEYVWKEVIYVRQGILQFKMDIAKQ